MTISSTPLAGTAALVTGASSGIGEATARTLAALGAALTDAGRTPDLDATRAAVEETWPNS